MNRGLCRERKCRTYSASYEGRSRRILRCPGVLMPCQAPSRTPPRTVPLRSAWSKLPGCTELLDGVREPQLAQNLSATKCHEAILSCTRQTNELENKERFIFFDSSWPFRPEFSHLLVWEASPSTTDSVLMADWGSHAPLRGDISEQTSIKYDSHERFRQSGCGGLW